MRKLYPFQRQAVAFHLAHHYSLNCSEMGTGKSLMALATAREVGIQPLIVAPAFLASTWEHEALECGVRITFLSYSMLGRLKAKDAARFPMWIADECHYLKTPTAQRTHAFYSLLKEVRPERFIGLSGTPIKNRVPDFWTLLAFCGLNPKGTSGKVLAGEFSRYHAFARHFCVVDEVKIRGRRFPKYRGIRADRVEEFKTYLADKVIRFRVDEVLPDLPALTRKQVYVRVEGAGSGDDERLREVFEAYQQGGKTDVAAKLRSAVLKAPLTAEYCNELLDGGSGPLLVFTDHIESCHAIFNGVKTKAKVAITGGAGMDARQRAVADFQRGAIAVLVATTGSLSVGVTLTASRHVVFNDLPWVPSDLQQAEKRIHRIGQKDACWSHLVEATPTDRYIRETLLDKIESIKKVIG